MDLVSRAKINLSLKILGRLENGYHSIETIMQSIRLEDKIEIEEIENDEIRITSNSKDVPCDESNLAYSAAKAIKDRFGIQKGVGIHIEKNIPVAAGLAGGSSNAAAVIVGLNEMWKLNLSEETLVEIGLGLGADVPFCIFGGCYFSEGIGEKLSVSKGLMEDKQILICKPDTFISTKKTYEYYDDNHFVKGEIDSKKCLKAVSDGNIHELKKYSGNDLDGYSREVCPEIDDIIKSMDEHSSLFSMVSGSGPTVFGIFDDDKKLRLCYNLLREKYSQTYICEASGKGVEIIGK